MSGTATHRHARDLRDEWRGPITCPSCGQWFVSLSGMGDARARYCSARCRTRDAQRKRRARHLVPVMIARRGPGRVRPSRFDPTVDPVPLSRMPDRLLRIEEVADLCAVKKGTVYRWIADGRLHVVRIGRTVRVRPDDIRSIAEGDPPGRREAQEGVEPT